MFGIEGSFLGEELEVAIDPFIFDSTVQGFSIVTTAWGKKYCDRRLFEAQSGGSLFNSHHLAFPVSE